MKGKFFRYIFFFLPILFTLFTASAQNLTGIWKGYFVSEDGQYYKLEFQISHNGSYSVTGVSYSYLDIRFYGKATMTGSFIKSSSSFRIKEIKTVEVKSSLGGATCIMNYNFQYSKSGKEEFLDGTYLGKYEPAYQLNPPGKWGDCGGGKVHLRRVTSSDFYIEPFLKNKIKNIPIIYNQPPGIKDSTKIKKDSVTVKKIVVVKKPPVTKPVAKTNIPPAKKPVIVSKPPVSKPVTKTNTIPPAKKIFIDTTQKTHPVVKITPPPVKTPEILKTRTNELVKVLIVNDPEVTVKLFDNGEIDGDSISVYLDKKLVLASKGLTASPLIVKFKIDDENSDHELIMVAENLGRIPPNTSLMIVEAGEQRFEVRITSTEQKNAMVKFKYEKPK